MSAIIFPKYSIGRYTLFLAQNPATIVVGNTNKMFYDEMVYHLTVGGFAHEHLHFALTKIAGARTSRALDILDDKYRGDIFTTSGIALPHNFGRRVLNS